MLGAVHSFQLSNRSWIPRPRFGEINCTRDPLPAKDPARSFNGEDIEVLDKKLLRAFTQRFPVGAKILTPVAPDGPVLVTTVKYNNGRILNLENPLAKFLTINLARRGGQKTGYHEREGLVSFLPPIVLPGHETWASDRKGLALHLQTLLKWNLPLVNNPHEEAEHLWQQQFHEAIDRIYEKPGRAFYHKLTNKQTVYQIIGFTTDRNLVIVASPKWNPGTYTKSAPLTGFELPKALSPKLWPQVKALPEGRSVNFILAPPEALKPILSEFEYDKAGFVLRGA
jgi:hypothetical protein